MMINILLGLIFAGTARAAEQSEIFELKARLEESVAKKYRDRISTRIPNELFNVGAQVNLVVKKELVETPTVAPAQVLAAPTPVSVPAGTAPQELPADVALGIIANTNPNLKAQAAAGAAATAPFAAPTPLPLPNLPKERIKITRVEVFVGLSPKVGANYKALFTQWLNANVRSEFGAIGIPTVSDLVEIPKEKEEPKPPEQKVFELKMDPRTIEIKMPEQNKPRLLNWEERFGHFQNLIGLSILAFFVIAGLVVGKLIPSKDVKEQAATAIKVQEMANAQAAELQHLQRKAIAGPRTEAAKAVEKPAANNIVFESYRDHQRKVAFLALSSEDQMDEIIDMWLDQAEGGRKKLASVMDCILTHLGIAQFAKNSDEVELNWSMPDKVKNDKQLTSVFRAFAEYSMDEKMDILEKAYWDLLSFKTLGEKSEKQRFGTLAALAPATIHKVLSSQDRKVKSLTLLHLPTDKLGQVVSSMSYEDKKSIIDQAFEHPRIKQTELDVVDQSLNFLIEQESQRREDIIETPSLLPNLLSVLRPYEEIQLVREITSKRPDTGQYLRAMYPALAFIGHWPSDKLKLLLGGSRPEEIIAVLQAMPEMTEKALSVLPPRTRAMLKADLGQTGMNAEDMDSHLDNVRSRVLQMVDDGEVNLRHMFEGAGDVRQGLAA